MLSMVVKMMALEEGTGRRDGARRKRGMRFGASR
jgi:hypothetical protein